MKRLMMTLAVALLFAGAAHAQSDAPLSGAPLELRPSVLTPNAAPVHTRAAHPVPLTEINPTAGNPRPAVHKTVKHKPVVHKAVAHKPVAMPAVQRTVHARAAHAAPLHAPAVHAPAVHASAARTRAIHVKAPIHHAVARSSTVKTAHHRKLASNTPTMHSEERRRSDALNDLSAQGYADYKDFHRDGDRYVATVSRNGHDVRLTADPRTHKIATTP